MSQYCMKLRGLLALFVVGTLPALTTAQPQTQSQDIKTFTVTRQAVTDRILFDARIQAVNQATVSAETQGRVQDIQVNIGDSVVAGTVLITMTSTEQHASLAQAEASLADAKSALKTDTAEFHRISDLQKKGFVSKTQLDRATAQLNSSKARVNSAKAALRSARQQLSYTEVKAPFSGIVSDRHIEVGEAVRPGTPLMSGYSPTAYRVEVDIPQKIAEKVRQYREAKIYINSINESDQGITPTKLILYPVVDPTTGSVRVRLRLPDETPGLYPGQFVEVAFDLGEQQRLLIPSTSVVQRTEVSGVYVMKGDSPHLRQVRIGARYGDKIEVLAGVEEEEKVALDPALAAERLTTQKPAELEAH